MISVPLSNQQVKDTSTTKKMALGTLGVTADGRKFRYARNNASNAALADNLQVASNEVSNHQNRLIDDVYQPAVGDLSVQLLSIGATAITADQYADGYLVGRDGTGEGFIYQIEGHSAYGASATDVIIKLKNPIEVAMLSTSEVELNANSYDIVQISVTDQADFPSGIAHRAAAVSEYFWIQTGGPAPVWADETLTKGKALTTGTGTAGQLEELDGAGEVQVGIAVYPGVDGEETLAFLTID